MILTESLILSKAKGFSRTGASKDVSQIRSINLWGQNLDDVSCLAGLRDLEVVSLPVNRISDLSAFSYLSRLTELYLRKNEIADPRQLANLIHLPLKNLWIAENPFCDKIPNYRLSMIRLFPNLQKLDDKEVTDRERRDSAKVGDVSSGSESGGSPLAISPAKVSPTRTKPINAPTPIKQRVNPAAQQQQQPRIPVQQPNRLQQQQHQELQRQPTQNAYQDDNDDRFFDNVRAIEQRYSQPLPENYQPRHSDSEDEQLRAQIELLQQQRQRRKTTEPLSKSYDEKPLRPAPTASDYLIGQGIIGSYDSHIRYMQQQQKIKPKSSSKPSYDSQILREKQFQDHLGRNTSVAQVPIQKLVDHRKKHDDGRIPGTHLSGADLRVEQNDLNQNQRDFRMRNPDWENENNHLEGASMHVTNDKEINTDFRRRAFGPFGDGAQHLSGAGANVDFIPHREHDYRYRQGDLHHPIHEEHHLAGSSMAVKVGPEYHDPRLDGREKYTNPHVQGSGMRVLSDEDYDGFPVMEVQNTAEQETIKASRRSTMPAVPIAARVQPAAEVKGKPEWLKEPVSKNPANLNVGNAAAARNSVGELKIGDKPLK
ncbi:UNVERIFIED_CONTAM: hypothetical protein HDU68_011428 [Siphonaria sp. JEL0065]|nr:hypothetical protein HDU68_011428 [Siphonaria sp. JEL0065]